MSDFFAVHPNVQVSSRPRFQPAGQKLDNRLEFVPLLGLEWGRAGNNVADDVAAGG
jgi:hypothetical protein